ncbi:HNH endonuclease, partial [Rhodococcus sp. ENV425]
MPIPESSSTETVPDPALAEGDKADILARTVAAIDAGDLEQGRQILRSEYPF